MPDTMLDAGNRNLNKTGCLPWMKLWSTKKDSCVNENRHNKNYCYETMKKVLYNHHR